MKTNVQRTVNIITHNAPVLAKTNLSASADSAGFSRITGILYTTGSANVGAASGFHVAQGTAGSRLLTSASYAVAEGVPILFDLPIYAPMVFVDYYNGDVDTPEFALVAQLYPV